MKIFFKKLNVNSLSLLFKPIININLFIILGINNIGNKILII